MYTPVQGSKKKGLSQGILDLELVPRAELPVDGHYLTPSIRRSIYDHLRLPLSGNRRERSFIGVLTSLVLT